MNRSGIQGVFACSSDFSTPHPGYGTAFLRGALVRGEAAALTGYSDRAGRDIIGALLKEGLLESDSPKGPVRMGLPMHAVPYLFPGVFPEELMD